MYAPILMAPLFTVTSDGSPTGQVEGQRAVETSRGDSPTVQAVEHQGSYEPQAPSPQPRFLTVLLQALSAWPT